MMRALVAAVALCGCAVLAHAAPPPETAFDLGRQYRHGAGVARDSERAFALIHGAALDQHAPAMFIVSAMLAAGEGAPGDEAAARKWLEAAAEREYPEAIQQLAMNLQHGAPGYEVDERRAAQLMRQVAHAMKHRAHAH
jgi:TPR repeat protein